MDANYFTTELMEEKWDRDNGEGGAGQKCPGGEEGIRQTNGHEARDKRVNPKYS